MLPPTGLEWDAPLCESVMFEDEQIVSWFKELKWLDREIRSEFDFWKIFSLMFDESEDLLHVLNRTEMRKLFQNILIYWETLFGRAFGA